MDDKMVDNVQLTNVRQDKYNMILDSFLEIPDGSLEISDEQHFVLVQFSRNSSNFS